MYEIGTNRLARLVASTSTLALLAVGGLARAQETVPGTSDPADQAVAPADDATAYQGEVIVVTAQRRTESLQDVPIAVSALSAEALEAQQIDNPVDLQLSLPNVTFTKTNFTTSSFTIRGIGDLCTGVNCDQATAIHLDGTPLLQTRLFETEFFDLERLEVLRGPQGTLFGRNATSGVVNFIPARPDLNGFFAEVKAEYGNYDAVKASGTINLPLSETIGLRVAGFYQNREGYTRNRFDGRRIDDRDVYALRGLLRFEPSDTTTVDLLASYTREKDNRLRIQKQQCQRDPTGVLGCLNGRRDFGTVNAHATIFSTLTSREFLALNGIPTAFALGSIYGSDAFATAANPADKRQVVSDFNPSYFSDEEQYQARIEQELGSLKLQLTGFYHKARVDSRQDYTLAVQDRAVYQPGLAALAAAAAGGIPGLPSAYFAPLAAALIPNGPAASLCTSLPEETGTGVFGGNALCTATPQDFDRSVQFSDDWSVEGILTSDFDGPFNFLFGGIYVDGTISENSYYVNAFPLDYASGLLGTFSALARAPLAGPPLRATPIPPSFLATPFFRNHTDQFKLKSYGIFGEVYYDLGERLKLTLGARYNNDKKTVRARSTLGNFLAPFGTADAFSSPFLFGYAVAGAPPESRLTSPTGALDADPATPCSIVSPTTSGILAAANVSGCELFQQRKAKFDEWTGRAVIDYEITSDNLVYASYSRGYKSGGINPPLQPIFEVPDTFAPELIDAFEIGSKNAFAGGKFVLNLTGFYYKYKQLQLSRIVARTSVNDNIDADIYGLEAEAVIRPSREFAVNLSASYLNSKVRGDEFLANPRDPGGGRADAVIIKDITSGANCAVVPNTAGNAASVNAYVAAVNAGLGLRAPTTFPSDSGIVSTGAFGVCPALQAAIADPAPALRAAFATPTGPLPFTVETAGVPINIRGNRLPQAPTWKFAAGAQYTHRLPRDWSLVPRVDLSYTGEQQGSIFGGKINEIDGFVQVNAQVQLNGPDERWFVRGYVQNLFDSNATTGLFVSDASTGLFTNLFTLEPRRYGIAAGMRF